MYNDPSGEFFVFLGLGILFWKAVIIGAAVGLASYLVGSAIAGQRITLGGALKSIFWGAVSGAVTFGIGDLFQVGSVVKAVGNAKFLVQGMAHGVAQGALSLMQGGDFWSGAAAGFLGHLGAEAWGATMKGVGLEKFAGSDVGTIAFGALSGGIGAELTGGNFWQGAVTGGIVAGLNSVMHGNFGKKYDVNVLEDYGGAHGAGHQAIAFENENGTLKYISKDGTKGTNPVWGESKNTIADFKNINEINDYYGTKVSPGKRYDVVAKFRATRSQINVGIKTAISYAKMNYNLFTNSCTTMVQKSLQAMYHTRYVFSPIPNENFSQTIRNYKPYQINSLK